MPLTRTTLLCCGLLLASAACQSSAVVEPVAPTPAAVRDAVATAPTPAPAAPALTPADAPPISAADKTPKVTRNADGTVRLEFVDRWGKRFDSTYETSVFLERALPVITRGMTAEQTAQLENQLGLKH